MRFTSRKKREKILAIRDNLNGIWNIFLSLNVEGFPQDKIKLYSGRYEYAV
jgi:hypothetical protein